MSVPHAFVDESMRGSDYYVCAVVTMDREIAQMRKMARDFRKQGQRVVHFANESDSRRKQFLAKITESGVIRARAYFGKGEEAEVRDLALRAMTSDLAMISTRRLIIESRQDHRDRLDRHAVAETLKAVNCTTLQYEHFASPADPALWIADAVAWSYSAGGTWRQKLTPILDREARVTAS